MEEYPNIFATNFVKEAKIARQLKRRLSQDLYTWSYYNFRMPSDIRLP